MVNAKDPAGNSGDVAQPAETPPPPRHRWRDVDHTETPPGLDVAALARRLEGKAWAIGPITSAGQLMDMVDRGESGAITGLTPGDPRGIGVVGGYPQINRGHADNLLVYARYAYNRSAPARILCDRVASDQWDAWFKLSGKNEDFKDACERFFRNPTGALGEYPMKWWFKLATIMARRDGRCLLHYGLIESNPDPSKPPRNPKGLAFLQLIPEDRIKSKKVGEDPGDPATYRKVLEWHINVDDGEAAILHGDRVQAFIPRPRTDDVNEGDSVLTFSINYVEAIENLIYDAVGAYHKEATPWIVVYKEQSAPPITADERAQIKSQLGSLEQSLTQHVFVKNVRVEILAGSAALANPQPHWDIALDAYCMATGLPKSMLRGDSAGELSSAQEDSRRWAAYMKNVKEAEGDPLVNGLLDRLRRWNVEGWNAPPELGVDIAWNDIYEDSPKQIADLEEVLMRSRTGYVDRRLLVPKQLEWEPTERPDLMALVDQEAMPERIIQYVNPRADVQFSDFTEDEPLGPRGAKRLIQQGQRRILAVLRPAYLRAAKGVARAEDAASRAADGFDTPELRVALAEELAAIALAASNHGTRSFLSAHDADQYYRALTRAGAPEIVTLSETRSAEVVTRLSAELRRVVAEAVAQGIVGRELTSLIMARFESSSVDAARLARTETATAYNRGAINGMRAIGVSRVEWTAFPDADADCLALNGQVMTLEQFEGIFPIHPNDRCQPIATGPMGNITLETVTTPEGSFLGSRRP